MAWQYAALAAAQLVMSYSQVEAIKKAGELQKKVNDFNAEYAELDAYNAWKNGVSEANRYSSEADKALSDQKVAYAVNDVDTTYGTAASVTAESKLNAYLNTLDLQNRAFTVSSNFKRQAIQYRLGSKAIDTQTSMNASATQTAGLMNAGSTFLSGYGKK